MTQTEAAIVLPPPFTLVTLREVGDAFAHATSIAAERGAGTLVYVGRFDLCEFAVVLEPDEPLRTARRILYAGMNALADAIIALSPPNVPVDIVWPDTIRVNLGLVGGGRIGWPQRTKEDEVPDWLVFGATIRTVSMGGDEAGLNPLATALEEEGFTDTSGGLLESFARNLMVAVDAWQESGFAAISREYLPRLAKEQGVRRDIDENGDLLIRRMDTSEIEHRALLPLLAVPTWLDAETRGPKL